MIAMQGTSKKPTSYVYTESATASITSPIKRLSSRRLLLSIARRLPLTTDMELVFRSRAISRQSLVKRDTRFVTKDSSNRSGIELERELKEYGIRDKLHLRRDLNRTIE